MSRPLTFLVSVSAMLFAACASQESADVAAETVTSASATEAPTAPALDDATIVAIFDAANTADIETGQLAAERGSSKTVRDFGAMLVHDHTAVRQSGRDLAGRLGVTPTPPAGDASTVAHMQVMTQLRSKQGVEFDKAFLEHEVAFHQGVIDAVQTTLLPAIQNAEVKQLVVEVAPAFEAHRLAAANLRSKLD